MRRSVFLDMKRDTVHEAAGRFRTANPGVFGSVLHGTAHDGSDLGVLQDELESLLGLHVDLPPPGDLQPRFRAKVLAEAEPA